MPKVNHISGYIYPEPNVDKTSSFAKFISEDGHKIAKWCEYLPLKSDYDLRMFEIMIEHAYEMGRIDGGSEKREAAKLRR